MTEYLFTYGTLRPEFAPADLSSLILRLVSIGSASVRGRLYDLGEFPGAVLDPAAKTTISGEVFKLPDDESVLAELDSYEEYEPHNIETSLFIRKQTTATLANGRRLACWIYVLNSEPGNIPHLPGGNYAGVKSGLRSKPDLKS